MASTQASRKVTCKVPPIVSLLLVCALGFGGAMMGSTPAGAGDEPERLLQEGTVQLDAFVDHFRRTGDFSSGLPSLARAQAELEEARRGFEQRGDWASAALCLIKLGQSQRMQGRWNQAIDYYRAAEAAALKAGNRAHQAKALMDRSKAELQMKTLGDAAEHAAQAVRITEEVRDSALLFDALDVYAQILVAQGNTAGAADSLNRAFALGAAVKDESLYYGHLDRAEIYLRIAQQCDYKRSYQPCLEAIDRSRSDYQQARETAHRLGWEGLARMTQGFIDELKLRRTMIESSRKMEESVASSGQFSPRKPGDVLVTEEFDSTAATRIPPPVIAMYQEAKAFERRAGGFGASLTSTGAYVEGMYQHLSGDQEAALRSFLKAVDLLDQDRRSLRDEEARGAFTEDKMTFYYAPIRQLLQQRRYADAFQLMERSRARGMVDLLASRQLAVSRPAERTLYAEAVRLRSSIAKKQSEEFGLINRGAERASLADVETEIVRLEDAYRQLQARIAREEPRLADLTATTAGTSLTALQQAMRRDDFEVLEYLALDTGLILWHISADAVHVRNVFLPLAQLQDKVNTLRQSLINPDQPFDERSARELYLYLIQPARAWMKSSRLVLVPSDCLHLLPFQVLTDPSNGRSVGESFQISYAPSSTVLMALKPALALGGAKLFAVSDPDFETEGEAKAVASVYGNRGRLITTLPAKPEIERSVAGYDVIHLSVHGQFDAVQPLLSYLRFSPADGDDGRLTAAEMFGLPLGTSRLVVLSACESGKVAAGRGDDVVGIVRGLLYAGAGTLVLSYWKVNAAATSAWMETFHRAAQQQPPAEAARRALIAVRSMPRYGHPYYWAAFMLVSR